jgi:hypothetical protein
VSTRWHTQPLENPMISTTLLLALAVTAEAAPWPVTVEPTLSEAPRHVTLYAPKPGASMSPMPRLQRAFAMPGQAERSDDLGGLEHIGADGIHLVSFDDGGAHYHDTVVLDDDQAMVPMSDGQLWQESRALLGDLGLLAEGPAWLEPTGTGFVEHFTIDPDKGEHDIRTTHQGTTWTQVIDGLPCFGGGAETQILFGDGGAVASFHHAQRPLEAVGLARTLSPGLAIDRFLLQADRTGRWNHYKAGIAEVDHVHLHDAELGYLVPGRGEGDGAPYLPVYAITGTVHGVDHAGQPTTVDLLWYQPALQRPAAGPRR